MSVQQAALAARRYFVDGRTKVEIAEQLGISRFKVARLIEEAREQGLVHIRVDMPAEVDAALGQAVAARFGIARVAVSRTVTEDAAASLAAVGTAAAEVVRQSLKDGEVLGISWGATIGAVVDALGKTPRVDVVQLVGGLRAAPARVSGDELVRRLAQVAGGTAYPLHAPMIVTSAGMAHDLRAEPGLADTIRQYPRLSVALVGIGTWPPRRSSLASAFTSSERKELTAGRAVADICGRFVDRAGASVESTASERTVGIGIDELRAVPTVIAVAAGAHKAAAIAAALRSGLVTALVIDSDAAEALLRQPASARKGTT